MEQLCNSHTPTRSIGQGCGVVIEMNSIGSNYGYIVLRVRVAHVVNVVDYINDGLNMILKNHYCL